MTPKAFANQSTYKTPQNPVARIKGRIQRYRNELLGIDQGTNEGYLRAEELKLWISCDQYELNLYLK